MPRLMRLLFPFWLVAWLLVGCGYKGDLSLPEPSPPQTAQAQPSG